VAKAAILASVQEQLREKLKKNPSKASYPKPISGSDKGDNKASFSINDLWKARQLKEFRRANGLCYRCGEKYTPGHKCASN
jgi:hypothetical protein